MSEEKITGGTYGISAIPRPTILGIDLNGHVAYYWFTLGSLVVLGALLWWLLRSPWGRAFAALRDNPIRAESLGINITAYTLLAFAIGAACAGVGGVYFASLVEYVMQASIKRTVIEFERTTGSLSQDLLYLFEDQQG